MRRGTIATFVYSLPLSLRELQVSPVLAIQYPLFSVSISYIRLPLFVRLLASTGQELAIASVRVMHTPTSLCPTTG